MQKLKIFTLLMMLFCIQASLQAQQLFSTKILKSLGFAEVHQIINQEDGYLIIGSQGNDVMHKKLWLVALDAKMKVTHSELVYNFDITTPIKYTKLANHNIAILAQEKMNDEMQERTLLFYLNSNYQIDKTIIFNEESNIQYTCITSIDNNILLAGIKKHSNENIYGADEIAIAKLNNNGELLNQFEYNFSDVQFNIVDIIVENNGHILCTGNATPMQKNSTVLKQVLGSTKKWMAVKFNANGKLLHNIIIPNYANYNYSNSIISKDDQYIAVLNKENYFGQAVYVTLNKNLKIVKAKKFEGSPALISGVSEINNNIVFGALFSNDVQNYSPGYIHLNSENYEVKAKSTTTLFDFFFINTLQQNAQNGFFVGGIGYNNHAFSDVYIYPFSKDGMGICDYENKNVAFESVALDDFELELHQQNNGKLQISHANAITQKGEIELSSACAMRDDLVVPEEKNKDWNAWQKNNAEVFEFKIPEKWMTIYPNPNNGLLKLAYLAARSDNLILNIYNSLGTLVMQKRIINHDIFEVDISALAAGKYFVKINDGYGEMVETLIRE